MATGGQSGNTVYIYNLPFCERTELCKILNQSDKWEELAGKKICQYLFYYVK